MDEQKLCELLHELTQIAAPSGNEDRATAFVASTLRRRGLSPTVDRLGQVTVSLGPPAAADSGLLIFAHLDELGLVVRGIEPDGYIRVHRLGGVPERVLPGTRVVLHTQTGDLPAVIGLKSHHLTPADEKYVALPASALYVDLGYRSADEARAAGVRIGDPMTYAPSWTELANGRVAAKSLDNRLGVTVLLSLIDELLAAPPTLPVHVAFSVQEEFNVRGTLALVAKLEPALALCLDGTVAGDTPDLHGEAPIALGAGPAITRLQFHGRGTLGGLVPHPAVLRGLESAAKEIGCPVQYEATLGVITDAAFLPMATRHGVATGGVGIPTRYTHSPVETAQLSDLVHTVHLLEAFVRVAPSLDLERGEPQLELGGMS
jgi:putative aminopeptidase FrvX